MVSVDLTPANLRGADLMVADKMADFGRSDHYLSIEATEAFCGPWVTSWEPTKRRHVHQGTVLS
jgi:isochorismate hydrolase